MCIKPTTAILCLFIIFILTSAQSSIKHTIIGTYVSKIAFLHDQSETTLSIKKNFIFEETVISKGNNYKNKRAVTGTWIQKGDTVILSPLKLKSVDKMMIIHTYKTKTNTDCATNTNDIFCKADTFLFKDNGLWRLQPLYKEFTRK